MAERHLFVLWERAANKPQIVKKIGERFEIKNIRHIQWQHFTTTLSRFYQQDVTELPKESHTGSGPFMAIEVEDHHPLHDLRQTSRGVRLVNINTFDTKLWYRDMAGDPDTVHASDSPQEASANIALLDEPGAEGWDSLEDMFSVLGETTKYVVLRDFEDLPEETAADLDLLVEDRNAAFWALNAKLAFPETYRVHVYVTYKDGILPVDLRFVGDCYMDPVWERDILARREWHPEGFYIPCVDDWYWSLTYHCYIHKGEMTRERAERLGSPSRQTLANVLCTEGYRITVPQDLSVPALPL